MRCKHFGECGSCTLYSLSYQEQLQKKRERQKKVLRDFWRGDIELFQSPDSHYRARAEFRILHKKGESRCFYGMGSFSKRGTISIDECPKVIKPIDKILMPLLNLINSSQELSDKLFGVEFLSGLRGNSLITMLYHKKLGDDWIEKAKEIENRLKISVIGRSRKQKIVLSKEYIKEHFQIDNREFYYHHFEGSFTQPNPFINRDMISWCKNIAKNINSYDLLELYCGAGNFTIPLSLHFNKVLATEISKKSISSAKRNMDLNGIKNISFARLSSFEMVQALKGIRRFNRLREVDLSSYQFKTVFVDPPRAGLDKDTLKLVSEIDNIIYISCNLESLERDLRELNKTHQVENVALFDQFPYTNHIESGLFLRRRD